MGRGIVLRPKSVIWFLLIFGFALSAFAVENITKVRAQGLTSNYLSNEDLAYLTCTDEPDIQIRNSLFCLDDSTLVNIDSVPWEGQCSLATYDLEDLSCQNLQLQTEYIANNDNVKLTDRIRIRRVTSVLRQIARGQNSDGSWGDAISTAYALLAYSSFPEAYKDEIQKGLDWLKENRHNGEKCYPESNCDTKTTANILAVLRLAGYNTSLRTIHDGELWLLSKQNVISGSVTWQLNFTPVRNLTNSTSLVSCMFNNSQSVIFYNFTYTLLNTSNSSNATNATIPLYIEANFTATHNKRIDLICTSNITANLTSHLSELVNSYGEGDNFTYTVPDACWSDKEKWDSCQPETTMLAMMTGISSTYRDLAIDYLDSLAQSNSYGNFIDETDISQNAYYLYIKDKYYDDDNATMLQWLLYNQNNDGSWSTGEATNRIDDTGAAVMIFEKLSILNDTEFIEDAKDWISKNEPSTGWPTIVKAALAFNALKKDIRPFVKSTPIHIRVTEQIEEVTIYNPTTFTLDALTFELSENLQDSLVLEVFTELAPDTSRKISITQTGVQPASNYGYLSIKEDDVEIAKIPVSVFKHETIGITYPESVTLFGTSTSLKLAVSKSEATFSCTVAWDSPDISSKNQFEVSTQNEVALDIALKTKERRQEEFTGTITCIAGLNTKRIPLRVNINQYPTNPFAVSPTLIAVNSSEQDVKISIENLLTEPLTVSLRFSGNDPYFQLETNSVVINPKSTKEVNVINLIPNDLNLSSSTRVIVEALGQSDNIIITTEIEVTNLNFVLFSSVIVFVLAIFVGVGILYRDRLEGPIRNIRQYLPNSLGGKPKTINTLQDAEVSLNLKHKNDEDKLKLSIIMNSIKILENAKKTEDEIRKKLVTEGFKPAEVDAAYKELDEISKIKRTFDEKKSTVAIIDTLNKNTAIIRNKLRQEGFTEKQIQAALQDLRNDGKLKEQQLKEQLKEKDVKIKE